MSSTQIPVSCPSCGALFASRAFKFSGNVQGLTLIGNKETCPFCGSMADVADGVFDISGDILSVISAPQVTKEMLKAFRDALKTAYEEKTPPEKLAEEVEKIDPSFGDIVRKHAGNSKLYAASLIIALAAIQSCSMDISLDVNQLIDQIRDTAPAEILDEGSDG